MRKFNFFCIISGLFICLTFLPAKGIAQPTDPADPGDDPDAPIDGGVSLLVAAGIGYGLKKYKDNKKTKI